MKYTPIIGLEVHVELKTKSKMFCNCSAEYFGKEPNSHTCPVCLGLPGALPVPNRQAIEWCIKISLALNCEINLFSKFDRKNYFYADLAKGYQISQYDLPFGHDGFIELKSGKRIRVRRVHMEEDTGKLSHKEVANEKASLIDFNRSGVPLVEIVTEPDFRDAEEVKEYLQKLQQVIRYLDVANADMEKGEMRLEPNISLSKIPPPPFIKGGGPQDGGFELPKYKVEVKNINSFRFVEKAVNYEIKRQQELLDNNETPAQETRGWNEDKNKTFSQRSKEEAHDYRYFPEPDIPPIVTSAEEVSRLKALVSELQDKKISRFSSKFSLSEYDAEIITREKSSADFFEEAVKEGVKQNVKAKAIANFIINKKTDVNKTTPAKLVAQIASSQQVAIVDEKELKKFVNEVIAENEKAVTEYKSGKESVLMFLLGQTMKKIGKKVDTNQIKEKLQQTLRA